LDIVGLEERKIDVKWKVNYWDDDYKFIKFHNISVEFNGERKFVKSGIKCVDHYCEEQIESLSPCTKYNICVHTHLTKSNMTKCIQAKTTCVGEDYTTSSFNPNYIIVFLIGLVSIVSLILGVVIVYKRKMCCVHSSEPVDTVEPRNEHIYDEIDYKYIYPNDKIRMVNTYPIYDEIKGERYIVS